jgi:hypothetical protein
MHRLILAIAAALVLSIGAVSKHAAAETAAAAPESAPAVANTGSVHKTAVVCGPKGCRHYWPRHYSGAVPPPPVFPPACPIDYYYACKQGPLGGQCACWPYLKGWSWE